MSEDLYIAGIWFVVVLGLASATHQLLRWAGVLVASQGAMLLIGAFSFASTLRNGFSAFSATLAAVLVCGVLGIAHRYILYAVGPLLFVLLCITCDVFLSEVWLAIPTITGGSGGLLLPDSYILVAIFSSIACVVIAVIIRALTGKQSSYWWATVREHGWHSGLFGVDDRLSLTLMFGVYGIITGFGGSAVAASMGYVSPSGLHLPFTMAIVMIAAASPTPGVLTLVTLSGLYAFIRTVLRQSVEASPIMAVIFEVLFPIALTLIVCSRVIYRRHLKKA